LLVVGAGPYGLAVTAAARERGIETTVVGHPLGFWRDHMPSGMFLRSAPDWHLDGSGVHTFEAFLEDRRISPGEIDPVPISVFLDYGSWFQAQKKIDVRDQLVDRLDRNGTSFVATLDDDTEIVADRVVAAPGVTYFRHVPDWAHGLPDGVELHTCDLVHFEGLAGARALIVGGRQSAYEWAALLGEHDVERVDIVHRHEMPRFERVSWKFVDEYMHATVDVPGWWRSLPQAERNAIARKFWEVGRLTLEWWLTPRLAGPRFHRWPQTHVVGAQSQQGGTTEVELSSGDRLVVDRIVFATGYEGDLARVPYLGPMLPEIAAVDGLPVLDTAFQSSIPGLYIEGFAATRDFGPFFGFTKACPVAAILTVDSVDRG
jgi:cation diffusion facilitator CzcD-associated flavoprotein CzcO